MTEPTALLCFVCPTLYPDRKPRLPAIEPDCDPCRERPRRELRELPDAYAQVARNLAPGQAKPGDRVSGSREAPLPLVVDSLDLTMPAPSGRQRWTPIRDPFGDQGGLPSVAAVLDSWVRDWREVRDMRESAPEPTVPVLARWLGDRLDWAMNHHPAIDEFCLEMSDLIRTLRRAAGTDRLVHRLSAPCPTCDLTELHREDGAAYVECRNCHRLWTEDEYQRLCIIAAAEAKVRASA